MQTFVPYDSFEMSAKVLDMKRLGKQRVETLQLLNAATGIGRGWKNHPAGIMWRENLNGLSAYGVAVCREWISRGYRDTCLEKISSIIEPDFSDFPYWWGDNRIHSSHRANLLRKDNAHYSQFGWTEDPEMPYFWPTASLV